MIDALVGVQVKATSTDGTVEVGVVRAADRERGGYWVVFTDAGKVDYEECFAVDQLERVRLGVRGGV